MIYLVGGDGFVGSAFVRKLKAKGTAHAVINRENFDVYRGTACDVLINANGNSKKYLSEQNPQLDFNLSVNSVLDSLLSFKYKKYIFLSSGDVYPDQSSPATTKEDQCLEPSEQSRYGLHKFLAEQLVRNYADNWLVFRMGGFVGDNLKKNAVFDILNNRDIWLTSDSELQFINTDTAATMILKISSSALKNEVINVGGDGVIKIAKIYSETKSTSNYLPIAKKIRFELNLDKLKEILGCGIPTTCEEVISYMNLRNK
jgi:nucleoside-diphosphate-sugar epimerase